MKRLLTIVLFTIICGCVSAQESAYAICKVLQPPEGYTKVEFSEQTKYLTTEESYEKMLFTFDGKKVEILKGEDVVSYLTSSWGWELCGNPIETKKGIMWTLRHEVDIGIVNFERDKELMKRQEELRNDQMYQRYYEDSH